MLNEEVDCNSSLDAPLRPEPAQCGHHLRCMLVDGHGPDTDVRDIMQDHWAPHGGAKQTHDEVTGIGSTGVYWTSDASVDGVRMLPVDSLEQGRAVLELARKIIADPRNNQHVADVSAGGIWVMQHPIIERVERTMLTCEYSRSRELDYTLHRCKPGQYVVTRDDHNWVLTPVPSDD